MLINAVPSSIPSYFMSIFKMPVRVANRLEKLQRDFFRGDGHENKKVHLINWDMVCKSKKNGGLGIGHMLDKNKSLLAKWVWRFGCETNSLWKKVLCARYGVDSSQLCWNWCSKVQTSSFVNSINSLFEQGSSTANCMLDGFYVIIDKGDRARFWVDIKWNSKALKDAFPRIFALS